MYIHEKNTREKERDVLVMPYSDYLKTMALHLHSQKLSLTTVVQRLNDETVTCHGLWKFYRIVNTTGSIAKRPGSGRESVLTDQTRAIIQRQMLLNYRSYWSHMAILYHHPQF